METLSIPLKYRVKTEYIGPDNKHIVAFPNQYVMVCAWIENQTTALACSLNNLSIGKIPADFLDLEYSWPMSYHNIYVAMNNRISPIGQPENTSFWNLCWRPGNHIKVYKWRSTGLTGIGLTGVGLTGIGLNLVTGKVGAFTCTYHELRPVL